MYDNTKLREALAGWLEARCEREFGETYAGDLLASFEAHCAETGALKRSPGRVVFGQELVKLGFDRRKIAGLVHYSGITLKQPPAATEPKVYAKTRHRAVKQAKEREKATEKTAKKKAGARKKRQLKVKKRMQGESAKRNRAAGEATPADN